MSFCFWGNDGHCRSSLMCPTKKALSQSAARGSGVTLAPASLCQMFKAWAGFATRSHRRCIKLWYLQRIFVGTMGLCLPCISLVSLASRSHSPHPVLRINALLYSQFFPCHSSPCGQALWQCIWKCAVWVHSSPVSSGAHGYLLPLRGGLP